MTRTAILSFARDYHVRTGKTPSVREISEGVEGVDRANFYTFFESKNELLNALDIEIEESDLPKKAAMNAKKKQKKQGGDFNITLNRSQSEQVYALAYMEGKPVDTMIDKLLNEQQLIRRVLSQIDEGNLDVDLIESILYPDLVYEGWNVSDFAGKPWVMLQCRKCGESVFFGEGVPGNSGTWIIQMSPLIKKMFKTLCPECDQPRGSSHLRIPQQTRR